MHTRSRKNKSTRRNSKSVRARSRRRSTRRDGRGSPRRTSKPARSVRRVTRRSRLSGGFTHDYLVYVDNFVQFHTLRLNRRLHDLQQLGRYRLKKGEDKQKLEAVKRDIGTLELRRAYAVKSITDPGRSDASYIGPSQKDPYVTLWSKPQFEYALSQPGAAGIDVHLIEESERKMFEQWDSLKKELNRSTAPARDVDEVHDNIQRRPTTESHEQIERGERSGAAEADSAQISAAHALLGLAKPVSPQVAGTFRCPECAREFSSRRALSWHHNKFISKGRCVPERAEPLVNLQCPHCLNFSTSPQGFSNHTRSCKAERAQRAEASRKRPVELTPSGPLPPVASRDLLAQSGPRPKVARRDEPRELRPAPAVPPRDLDPYAFSYYPQGSRTPAPPLGAYTPGVPTQHPTPSFPLNAPAIPSMSDDAIPSMSDDEISDFLALWASDASEDE